MEPSRSTITALEVLGALSEHVEPQYASALARRLGIPRTTTYRILAALVSEGYAVHDSELGRYSLGPAAYELAAAYQRQEPLRRVSLPIIDHLVDETHSSIHLALLRGSEVIYVVEQRGIHTPSLITEVGVRLPAEITASGRAMLSCLSWTQVDALYPSSAELSAGHSNSPTSTTELHAMLAETRKRGWAREIDSVTVGWSTLAVPVVDVSGYPLASLATTYRTALESSQLDQALDALLARGFARKLDRRERAFLRGLTGTLLERGGEVHTVMQHFARSLRGFVQSRGYLEQRRLNQLLKQAQGEALHLRESLHATTATGYTQALSGSRLRSLSQWRLHDPRLTQVDGRVYAADAAEISLDSVGDLVAQSEIDVRSLRRDLHALLGEHPRLTIGDALQQRPAVQGLGSVIGYLSLGTRHGLVIDGHMETVQWEGGDGTLRRARIPLVWFTREKRNELV